MRLIRHASPYLADFFLAMVETGCRPSELRTLQWSEVREDHFLILGAKAKDREERELVIEPKLREILDQRSRGPDGLDLPAEAYVFGDDTMANTYLGRSKEEQRKAYRQRTLHQARKATLRVV